MSIAVLARGELGRVAAVCVATLSCHSATAQEGPRGYAFENANVITMTEDTVLVGHTVIVLGDTIAAVARGDAVTIPDGVRVIDATGRYLMPGLSDMHVHLRHESELGSFLRYGVTTVLQMNRDSRTLPELMDVRRRIAARELAGPTIYTTGPLFAEGWFTPDGRVNVTPADVPRLLEEHRAAGYDFVKVHNMVPADVYHALVSADALPVIGHLPVPVGPDASLRSGQRMVAHAELFYYGYFFESSCLQTAPFWDCVARIEPDFDRIEEMARLVDSVDVYVTANLSYVAADLRLTVNTDSVLADPEFERLAPGVRTAWLNDLPADRSFADNRRHDLETRYPFLQRLVQTFADHAVPLLSGTDTALPGLYPGKSLHMELHELVRAGLSPYDALTTSTANAGRFIHEHVPDQRPFGVVAVGARADLLLLGGNPLVDIGNTVRIQGVAARGRFWTVRELDAMR